MEFTWTRYRGYEVSSRGDKRFSAFNARMPDGRSLEAHYQCDVKGYAPGSSNWRLGKGKPPLDRSVDLYAAYLALWRTWAAHNPALINDLRQRATSGVLSDRFASTPVNQARALADILNEEP